MCDVVKLLGHDLVSDLLNLSHLLVLEMDSENSQQLRLFLSLHHHPDAAIDNLPSIKLFTWKSRPVMILCHTGHLKDLVGISFHKPCGN